MNIDKIIQKMHEGIILLEYTSLNSGTQKKREVTTNRKYIPEEKNPFKKGGLKLQKVLKSSVLI